MPVCVPVCDTPSHRSQSGARRRYVLVHIASHQVVPLHSRQLFLEVGVHVPAPIFSSQVSDLLILGTVRRKVAAAAAAQDHSRTSELFIWPSDPRTE